MDDKGDKQPKFVSRVYTKEGIVYIGDTKFTGHSYLEKKTLETMINNGQIDAIISPPRPKGIPMPPTPVIKYTLDSHLSPSQMYQKYFENLKAKKAGLPVPNSDIKIDKSSTETVISCQNNTKEGYGFYWDLKDQINEPPAKKIKMTRPPSSTSASVSPGSSTAETIVCESSEEANWNSPNSSTAETLTFDSANEFCPVDFSPLRNDQKYTLLQEYTSTLFRQSISDFLPRSRLIEALDLCEKLPTNKAQNILTVN